MAIVSDFYFGVATAVVAAMHIKYLGDELGRERLRSLCEHKRAIANFP